MRFFDSQLRMLQAAQHIAKETGWKLMTRLRIAKYFTTPEISAALHNSNSMFHVKNAIRRYSTLKHEAKIPEEVFSMFTSRLRDSIICNL